MIKRDHNGRVFIPNSELRIPNYFLRIQTAKKTNTDKKQIAIIIQNATGEPTVASPFMPNGSFTFIPNKLAKNVGSEIEIVTIVRFFINWFTLLLMTLARASIMDVKMLA